MLLTICDKVWGAISLNNGTSKLNHYGYGTLGLASFSYIIKTIKSHPFIVVIESQQQLTIMYLHCKKGPPTLSLNKLCINQSVSYSHFRW